MIRGVFKVAKDVPSTPDKSIIYTYLERILLRVSGIILHPAPEYYDIIIAAGRDRPIGSGSICHCVTPGSILSEVDGFFGTVDKTQACISSSSGKVKRWCQSAACRVVILPNVGISPPLPFLHHHHRYCSPE